MNRRAFLKYLAQIAASSLASFFFLNLVAKRTLKDPDPLRPPSEPQVLRPPGARPEKEFLARCIRCQRCQNACLTGAIRLAGPGDGVQEGTPFIKPHDKACDLCLACTRVCPTQALAPVDKETDVRMGRAVVDKRLCVSHNGTGICGACYTACPFKNQAITQGTHNAPTIMEDGCVGCGLCEEACPGEGIKAIRVFSGRTLA